MSRIVDALRKIYAQKAPLSWVALLVSLIAQILVISKYLVASRSSGYAPENDVVFFLSWGGSTMLVFVIFLVERRRYFRIFLFLRTLIFMFLIRIMENEIAVDMLLVMPIILEICIYESFYRNLILCAATIAISFLIKSGQRHDILSALWRDVDYLFGSLLLTVVSGSLLHFRERCIDHLSRIGSLESAVAKLSKANMKYQRYASEAGSLSMIEERKRITREIHDVIGYTLTNNIMMMEAAIDMVRHHPEQVAELIETARGNAESGLEEIRDSLHLLRAHEPPTRPGVEALTRLVKVFEIATGTNVQLELGNIPESLGDEIDDVLCHLVQEALTNSYRHGQATLVKIICWKAERMLRVSIWDNGLGSNEIVEGIGIKGMRERIESVAGQLVIGEVSDGFRLSAEIPLNRTHPIKIENA